MTKCLPQGKLPRVLRTEAQMRWGHKEDVGEFRLPGLLQNIQNVVPGPWRSKATAEVRPSVSGKPQILNHARALTSIRVDKGGGVGR